MFLNRLREFAATSSEEMPPPFHAWRNVRWLLDLRPDGTPGINELVDLAVSDDPARRGGLRTIVPDLQRSGSAPQPTLGCDDLKNALGWTALPRAGGVVPSKDLERARCCHSEFTAQVTAWAQAHPTDVGARALCAFLVGGGPKRLARPAVYTPSELVMFRVNDEIVHHSPAAREYWNRVAHDRKIRETGRCLVCGQQGDLVDTFPRQVTAGLIPAVGYDPDSRSKNRPQPSAVPLASMNKPAMGFELSRQLVHAPVCVSCAESSVSALDHLLRSRDHTRRIGDTALTWWLLGADPDAIDPARLVFDPDDAAIDTLLADMPPPDPTSTSVEPDPRQAVIRVGAMVDSPKTGRRVGEINTGVFCAAALSANKTRLILRDWIDMPLPAAQRAVGRWFVQHQVLDPWTGGTQKFSLRRLALACGRWDAKTGGYVDLGEPSARRPIWAQRALLAAALRGVPLPPTLAQHLVERLRADHKLDPPRRALLRLLLARTFYPDKEIPLALDDTNDDAAYLAGRLFAVLESLQYAARKIDSKGKKLNTTLADRYLGAASTSPARVIPELLRGSQAHLKKLRSRNLDGVAVKYSKLRDDLTARLTLVPVALNVAAQCVWFNGYADQRTHFFAAARARRDNSELAVPDLTDETPAADRVNDPD